MIVIGECHSEEMAKMGEALEALLDPESYVVKIEWGCLEIHSKGNIDKPSRWDTYLEFSLNEAGKLDHIAWFDDDNYHNAI